MNVYNTEINYCIEVRSEVWRLISLHRGRKIQVSMLRKSTTYKDMTLLMYTDVNEIVFI